jgi:hypothetical protein
MKSTNITHWIVTGLFSAFMVFFHKGYISLCAKNST